MSDEESDLGGSSMRYPRRFGLLLLVAAVACVLGGSLIWGLAKAIAASESPSPSADKVTLRIGWPREPDNLNPFMGWENSSYEVWALNYSFLFGFGAKEEPTLDLASEFPTQENGGISADGKTITVKIKPDVMWSDGQPLTADDVAFTFNYNIENELYAFAISTIGIEKAEVVDPLTVKFTLSQPKADFEKMWVPIVPQHIWEKVKPGAAEGSYVNKPPIVGSGPFSVVEFQKGKFVRMERNPYYFAGEPAVDEIIFAAYQNVDTMTQDLKLGTIDAAWGLPQAQLAGVASTPGLEAISYNFYNWDYLNFNCYEGAGSLGNPVLRDEKFRYALNYAIDRERLVAIAWNGNAAVGTTIMPPDTWTDPDYHWQPPADQLYAFYLAKAGQLLDDAGYKDANGDGLRDYKGKPITLRLQALADDVHGQSEGKLIAGWFKQLGLKITLGVIDTGTLEDAIWNYQGNAYAPDFDMYLWDWDGFLDPGQTLGTLVTAQIESWNEPCWSDPEYDQLFKDQASELDPAKRQEMIWRMQQLIYEKTPWAVLTYPDHFEAYNIDKWTGWTRVVNGKGPAFYTAGNIDSYRNLKPVVAGVTSDSGGSSATIWIVAVVAIVVIGIVAWLLMRRRPKASEE